MVSKSELLSRQCLVVTAYKDLPALLRLVQFWCGNGGWTYVHLDRKSKLKIQALTDLGFGDRLVVYKKFSVHWGGLNHLLAVLYCLKEAVTNPHISYFHIVSGQDYPLHPASWFAQKFNDSKESYFSRDNQCVLDTPIKDWYALYHFPLDWRVGLLKRVTIHKLVKKFQNVFGIQRRSIGEVPLEDLRRCMIYGSCCKEAVQYMFAWLKQRPRFLSGLRFSIIPEECFFATVFYGSKWQSHEDCLCSMIWEDRGAGSPCALLVRDLNRIKFSCAFARKIDSEASAGLLEILEKRVNG